MPNAFSQFIVAAALCLLAMGAARADQAPPSEPLVDKQLSPECRKVNVKDPEPDHRIGHQYMLLLIFKKGEGSPYFGNATPEQNGCIPDVDARRDPASSSQVLTPTKTYLTVSTCPNDCTYPRVARAPTGDGNDPLNSSAWGILSAVDTKTPSGGPRRHVEIWEIAARDACHARALYAYHTQDRRSRFSRAYKAGHMLGEILVGYDVAGNLHGPSTPCP